MTVIDPDKLIPKKIENFFKPIPWSEWEKIPASILEKEDVGSGAEFKTRGEVPAGWIIRELGLCGFEIGPLKISEDDCNTIENKTQKGNLSHLAQLASFIKTKARDKIDTHLLESVSLENF